MPRRTRLAVPGTPWHIIQRGNNRFSCFYAEEEYRRYRDTLREQVQRHGCLSHSYVQPWSLPGSPVLPRSC